MPVRKFALKEGETRRLEIHWKGRWNDVNVFLDRQPVGNIPDQDALKEGRELLLKDGSRLKIRLLKRLAVPEFEILLNDQPIADSDTHPEKRMRTAAGFLFLIAGVNLLIGALAFFFHVELLRKLGLGAELLIFGAIYLILGFGTRKGSKAALGAGIFLFALDGILSIVMFSPQASNPPAASIVVRIFILVQLITAFRKAPAKAAEH
jgi:hypothetical protein